MKNWDMLTGDVSWEDYGAKWVRKDPNVEGRYYVLDFINMDEACGRDNEGHDTYICEVKIVDLSDIDTETMKSAYDCYGLDLDNPDYQSDLCKVDCLVGYGCSAPVGSHSGNSYPLRVRAAARREAEELMKDSELAEHKLDQPVNRIGSTAREFGRGDIGSAMDRIREALDSEPTTDMGVMTSLTPPAYSVRLNVNMKRVPSDDPLAYAHGFMTGCAGDPKPTDEADEGELADAWVEGYELGLRVKSGDEDIRNLNTWVKPAESSRV